ncbi:dehypoxanthine futalosine cyclase, partial [Campylobacter jejuni]|nr:dehypoxanthine futalosine cyclase [Campylobacter jejuni]
MKRMYKKEDLDLLHNASLTELVEMAYKRKLELHPEKITSFVVDRIINYTYVCCFDCSFCAFYRHHKEDDAYIFSFEEI